MSRGRAVAFIVSRLGSTRVPGKALLDIAGKPMITRIIDIAKNISPIDDVCLATTTLPQDHRLIEIARREGINVFCGDPHRVLDRLYHAAVSVDADILIYVGGDCPLLDPTAVSRSLREFNRSDIDYLSNYDPPTFPSGMDINVISFPALKRAYQNAVAPSQRVHPFSYLTFHDKQFKIRNIAYKENISDYHWSVDYPGDVDFINLIYRCFPSNHGIITMGDVLRCIAENAEVKQKHAEQLKSKPKHAFFSSPNIVKDISEDIIFLSNEGYLSVMRSELEMADLYFEEIYQISAKLRVSSAAQ